MGVFGLFRRKTEQSRTRWGYTFNITDAHHSREELEPLKFTYDKLGDDCYLKLTQRIRGASTSPRNTTSSDKDSDHQNPSGGNIFQKDLYNVLQQNHSTESKLAELWHEVNTTPDWVDWSQIARGQDVFYRYGGAILTGLTYQSLLGGMAAARVVETLARTGGFSAKVARRRLFETTQHILQCTKSLESIQPGGAGFASSVRVRLLHAAVRSRIMSLRESRSEYYNLKELGIPINDLDSIGTICTFSATLIWISLPRQGIFLRKDEVTDYIALWRYIAYLVGCPTTFLETPEKAKAIMECLLLYELEPSELSKTLANNIISSLQNQPPAYPSASMLVASARWLNGNALADRLGLPRPGYYYWALMAGQCIFYMSICYGYRNIKYLDRKKISTLRKILYAIIVESSYGLQGIETMFEFKYVPQYHTITELGESTRQLKSSSIEKRNLTALVISVLVVGSLAWLTTNAFIKVAHFVFSY